MSKQYFDNSIFPWSETSRGLKKDAVSFERQLQSFKYLNQRVRLQWGFNRVGLF